MAHQAARSISPIYFAEFAVLIERLGPSAERGELS